MVKPIKIAQADMAGGIFECDKTTLVQQGEGTAANVVTFASSDRRFRTGVYRSGPSRFEVTGPEGYPNNEYMYFISGGVTLTSADGSVVSVAAGDAVTIPRGWTGTWETDGYTKMYVVHDPTT